MLKTDNSRSLSYAYLIAVPLLTTALAFIVGHVHYTIYLSFWLLNAGLMIGATRTFTQHHEQAFAKIAWLFIIPWVMIAVFGGMGPPPESAAGWASLAGEQVARYTILIISSLLNYLGFTKLNKNFTVLPVSRFSRAGTRMISIALSLFMLNMAYWGYFLTYVFVIYTKPGSPAKPNWLELVSETFTVIRMTEVALIYLTTAAFACALKQAGWLSKTGSFTYIIFACVCVCVQC